MSNHRKLRMLFLFAPLFATAQDLKEFEKRVTEFTLPNGLHFIVLERHEAPVVSFHTYVNAGAVDDPEGKTVHLLSQHTEEVTAQDVLKVRMESAGGYLARLTPLPEKKPKSGR